MIQVILAILLLCFFAPMARGEKLSDFIPICTEEDGQFFPTLIADGVGGAVIVWDDYRTASHWDVYAQRLDLDGKTVWRSGGAPICTARGDQRNNRLAKIGSDILIVWSDRRGIPWNIYAQRLGLDGRSQWQDGGVPICTHPAGQEDHALSNDGKGGAIIAWEDHRNGSGNLDIYAQRIDSEGRRLWAEDGVAVCVSEGSQYDPLVISDAEGGAIITWWDLGGEEWRVLVQRIDSDGKKLWKENGIEVSKSKGNQGEPRIASDGEGGVVVVWQSYESYISDNIYAQRISPDGELLWGDEGVTLCEAEGMQKHPSIVADPTGEVTVSWTDERDVYADIYAQRLNGKGQTLWEKDGIGVCVAAGNQDVPFLASDFQSGSVLVWVDYREDYDNHVNDQIYMQWVDSSGHIRWGEEGLAVCSNRNEQITPQVVCPSPYSAIVVWSDAKDDIGDIYARKVSIVAPDTN